MKYGLSFLPDALPHKKSATDYFNEALKLAQIADRENLDVIKMTEHYLGAYGGYCPSPLMFLSAVAAKTQQIRLMTGCILPVFHHPIQIAAETAMLDAMSNGRLDVGFARAYLPYEFMAFGVDMDGSREKYNATIDAVLALWQEKDVTINTEYFNFESANSLPSPVQQPHPPVWAAAVKSRQSFAYYGEKGFKLLVTSPLGPIESLCDKIAVYRDSFQKQNTHTQEVALSLPLLIAPTDEEAKRLSDIYLQEYLNIWATATDAWQAFKSTDYPGYTGMSTALRQNSPERMRNELQAIIGSPKTVREHILKIQKTLGIDMFLWQIDFGAQPYDVSEQTLRLFVDEVKPALN